MLKFLTMLKIKLNKRKNNYNSSNTINKQLFIILILHYHLLINLNINMIKFILLHAFHILIINYKFLLKNLILIKLIKKFLLLIL